MAHKWNQLLNFRLTKNNQEKEYVGIRVSIPPDGSCVVTDIRKFRGNRALRVGVSLLPCELEWVLNMLTQSSSGKIEVDYRKISVSQVDGTAIISVQKPDGVEQKIQLNKDQVILLKNNEINLIETISSELKKTEVDIEMT